MSFLIAFFLGQLLDGVIYYVCSWVFMFTKTFQQLVFVLQHLNKLQEFWSTLEDIDKTLFVDSEMSSLSSRSIDIGDSFVSNQVLTYRFSPMFSQY